MSNTRQNKCDIYPIESVVQAFESFITRVMARIKENLNQAQTLSNLRAPLHSRLNSGQLRLPEAEAMREGAL